MDISPVMQAYILHWGEMGTCWGVNRTVAQIHALLYLVGRPLPADEIAATLKVARSNVSTSIRELQAQKLINRTHVLGDRRDHFEAETDLWTMMARILDERKKREIDPTLTMLRKCLLDARNDPVVDEEIVGRIKTMHDFLESADDWYDDVRDLPRSTLETLMKMGGKVARLTTHSKKSKKKKTRLERI